MADDINISYSFQTGPAGAAPPAEASTSNELIAFTSCERVDLGNGSVLLLNRDNGKQMAVSAEVVTALTYCTTFKTLQEHAAVLVNTIPQLQGQLADVIAVLNLVNGNGLMLNAQTVCDRLNPDTTPTSTLAPTRVCIITCDRPAAVERLLDSMLRTGNLSRHDELFLVDDSRDPANAEQNRELVAKFNLTSAKNMRYVGAAAQQRLMDELVAARPDDAAAVRFLIDRERWAEQQSYGLARTVCLLLTVGYRCIVLDDDVLCTSVLPPMPGEGISFGGGANRQLACYGSEQELMQSTVLNNVDPLTGHASCLGMPLAKAISAMDADGVGLDALHNGNATMLNSLQADSPILVTQCGSWGDPGTQGNSWFLELGPESVEALLAAPGGPADAMARRHYWLGRTRPNVSKMGVMAQATGLDNSHLLPPYFPVFRDEDYLFAAMLLYLHPGSAVLDYAWCVPHLPVEHRDGDSGESLAARGGLGLFARYLADRVDSAAGMASPATRLHKLAVELRELSERSPANLLAIFRAELARERAGQLQQVGWQLQQAPAQQSQDWQDYLQRAMADVSAALQAPAAPGDAADSPEGLSEEALLLRAGEVMAEFGAAIAAWPGIRDAAAAICGEMLATGELMP